MTMSRSLGAGHIVTLDVTLTDGDTGEMGS